MISVVEVLRVLNWYKISTVVDHQHQRPQYKVLNWYKISTVVDQKYTTGLFESSELIQNFYCCRCLALAWDFLVLNWYKISTVVDYIGLPPLKGSELIQNFYCCRLVPSIWALLCSELIQNFYCCRLYLDFFTKTVLNWYKISTVVDIICPLLCYWFWTDTKFLLL